MLKIRRKKGLILSQNKRQLILYSTIIELPYYKKLKELLTKYEKIYETDFEDLEEFDEELINLFKYAMKGITELAEKEWHINGDCKTVEEWPRKFVRCQLCNTKNKYIFYIENRLTNKNLNVGSECMIDFPTLNNIDGISIKDIKNSKIKEARKVARILKFNNEFPDVQNLIKDLENEYENVPILLPYNLYIRLPEIFKEMRKIYNDYIDEKIQDEAFSKFSDLLQEYFSLNKDVDNVIQRNMNNELICTKEIKEWLLLNGKEEIIELIANNNGLYDKKTIEYITSDKFLNKSIEKINSAIKSKEVIATESSDDKLFFDYSNKLYDGKIKFYISNIEFMHLFGDMCFVTKAALDIECLLKHFHIVWNTNNREIILSRLANVTKQLGYSITYKKEIHKVSYKNVKLDRYKEISFESFIDSNINLLFLSDKELKDRYSKIFNKINWQKIEDESKYKFSIKDISKNPYN